jgi:thiamine-monophosphate kinase
VSRSRLPSEERLVERLRTLLVTRRRDVLLGIGDDAAVVAPSGRLAVTSDVLVENADFRKDADPRRLGRKSLNVNLSDLAAMGATPLYALLTLGMPPRTTPAWFDAFVEGLREAASEYGVAVIGGDLSASGLLFASVTALGRAPEGGLLTRRGAAPGDALFVSGTLGAAAAGFRLLETGFRLGSDGKVRAPKGRRLEAPRAAEVRRLIRHQIDPRPMVDLGTALAGAGLASAAIDVSDGLARDLHRLCRASNVAATLDRDLLPVDSALFDLEKLLKLDPVAAALYGGEDFGLLFSVPARKVAAVERLSRRFALRRIGAVREAGPLRRVLLSEGDRLTPIPDAGFDHFGG